MCPDSANKEAEHTAIFYQLPSQIQQNRVQRIKQILAENMKIMQATGLLNL
jgi:hypothetical protein